MTALTNTMENRMVDHLLRGQPLVVGSSTSTWGAAPSISVALYTVAPTDSTPGTEVAGGSYARATVASSLANWSGTQGAGTTAVSSGTSGETSNNISVTFPVPTADWGVVVAAGLLDSAGVLLAYSALGAVTTILLGDPAPEFAAGTLVFKLS